MRPLQWFMRMWKSGGRTWVAQTILPQKWTQTITSQPAEWHHMEDNQASADASSQRASQSDARRQQMTGLNQSHAMVHRETNGLGCNSTRHLCGLTHRQVCGQARYGSWQGSNEQDWQVCQASQRPSSTGLLLRQWERGMTWPYSWHKRSADISPPSQRTPRKQHSCFNACPCSSKGKCGLLPEHHDHWMKCHCSHLHLVNCHCNWGTCIVPPPSEDWGCFTESIHILVPVNRAKQKTTKWVHRLRQFQLHWQRVA